MLPKTFKIMAYTPQISIAIQKWLLKNGYLWETGDQVSTHQAFPYIYVDSKKMLWDSDPSTFKQCDVVEVIPQFGEHLKLVTLIEVSKPINNDI